MSARLRTSKSGSTPAVRLADAVAQEAGATQVLHEAAALRIHCIAIFAAPRRAAALLGPRARALGKLAMRGGEKRTVQMGKRFHGRQSPLKIGRCLAAKAR
jgi:hypothetical protein